MKLEENQKEEIREMLADKLGYDLEEVEDESEIRDDLGADSLDEVELVMELEKMFNITIPDSHYEAYENIMVKNLYQLVEQNS